MSLSNNQYYLFSNSRSLERPGLIMESLEYWSGSFSESGNERQTERHFTFSKKEFVVNFKSMTDDKK